MGTRSANFGQGLLGLVLAFPVALFTQGALTDLAYLQTAELQWSNFSAWANAGALVFGGIAFLWSLILAIRVRTASSLLFSGVLLAMCLLGLVNAFKHSQDGWSSVGALGMTLSVICCVLGLIAGLMHYTGSLNREVVP